MNTWRTVRGQVAGYGDVVVNGSMELCVLGDFAWDVLIRTNNELLKGGDTFGEVMLLPGGSAANVAEWNDQVDGLSAYNGTSEATNFTLVPGKGYTVGMNPGAVGRTLI